MKFLSITLEGIRGFSLKKISFFEGFNIICGPNESGKSTILESILFAISGDAALIDGLKGWKTEHSSIELTYEKNIGSEYTIRRVLHPFIETYLGNEEIIEDRERIHDILQTHFGTLNRIILENSVFVKHNEIEILRTMKSKEIITEQVKIAFTGSQTRTVEEILQDLKDELSENTRLLSSVNYKIDQLTQQLHLYTGIDEKYDKIKNKLDVYSEDFKNLKGKREALKERIEYGKILQEVRDLEQKQEEIEDLVMCIEHLPFDYIGEKQNLLHECAKIDDRLIAINSEIEMIIQTSKERKNGNIFTKIINAFRGKSPEEKTDQNCVGKKKDLEYERFQLEKKKEEIENRIKVINSEIQGYEKMSMDDLVRLKRKYEDEMISLLSGVTIDELSNIIQRKQDDADDLRKKIFLKMPEVLEMDDLQVEKELKDLEQKISLLEEDIIKMRKEFIEIEVKKKEKDEIQNEIDTLKAKRGALEKKLEIDNITLDKIKEVYVHQKDLFLPRLESRTGNLMGKITNGKFNKIVIDRENMDVYVEIADDMIAMDSLSQGTRDQLCFSLRISLSELLGGGNLPLLFDESFSTSDKGRVQEIMNVLKEISNKRQVIFFTHNEEYLQYGNSILLEIKEENDNVSRVNNS